MAKRKSLGKKVRFDVFKRDQFTCQYCGGTPPSVVLHVDHIHPVSKGGGNEIDNLLTACSDCNHGKRDHELSVIPESLQSKAEEIAEREEQLKAFNRLLKSKRRRENKAIREIEEIFEEEYDRVFTPKFKESIRNNFLSKMNQDQLSMAAYKACAKCHDCSAAIKYFCGICWHIIKDKGWGR